MTVLPSVTPEDNRPQIVRDAIAAIDPFCADRYDAEMVLSKWVGVAEMTVDQMKQVIDHFPEADRPPMLVDPAPCPSWCAVDHERIVDDFTRTCQSAAPELPTLYAGHTVNAVAARINDRCNGKLHPIEVWVNDEYMPPATARRLATQILAAVELAEAG